MTLANELEKLAGGDNHSVLLLSAVGAFVVRNRDTILSALRERDAEQAAAKRRFGDHMKGEGE